MESKIKIDEFIDPVTGGTWGGTMNKHTGNIITSITSPGKHTSSLISGTVTGKGDVGRAQEHE